MDCCCRCYVRLQNPQRMYGMLWYMSCRFGWYTTSLSTNSALPTRQTSQSYLHRDTIEDATRAAFVYVSVGLTVRLSRRAAWRYSCLGLAGGGSWVRLLLSVVLVLTVEVV